MLQPRVTPSLPVGREGSLFQRIFSSLSGIDPYASAVSDVYQDLFGEGSYAGKGIYDVDAFEAALAGRVPDSTLLSHDLFEGVFARAGLASDVEVVEEFPAALRRRRAAPPSLGARRLAAAAVDFRARAATAGRIAKRGRPSGDRPLEDARQSAPHPVGALRDPGLARGLAPAVRMRPWSGPASSSRRSPCRRDSRHRGHPAAPRRDHRWRSHLRALGGDLRLALTLSALTVMFLAHQAWLMGDAIVRTLFASSSAASICSNGSRRRRRPTAGGSTWPASIAAWPARLVIGALAADRRLARGARKLRRWRCAFAALWMASPAVARWVEPAAASSPAGCRCREDDAQALRLTARRTWRFFETFVTGGRPHAAARQFPGRSRRRCSRTGPRRPISASIFSRWPAPATSAGSERDETVERLEATLATMSGMARFRGHFYNWYDTSDLRPLDPKYVSSVDSGNLAGHLIALANACREWRDRPPADSDAPRRHRRRARPDARRRARACATAARRRPSPGASSTTRWPRSPPPRASRSAPATILRHGSPNLAAAGRRPWPISAGRWPANAATRPARTCCSGRRRAVNADRSHRARSRAQTAEDAAALRMRARSAGGDRPRRWRWRWSSAFCSTPSASCCRSAIWSPEGALDPSCYDLLASEARLASFFAIAKGDVPARHWFRLGRAVTPVAHGAALISWSGSMFEYLMPSLVMRAPAGSLLEQTSRLVVRRQIDYGDELGMPWGISESAYNARDLEFTYQYSNFGVPGLGLKRGLGENIVVAPYATALAAMVDPAGGGATISTRLAGIGARGRYGFYEALDYTPSRVPEGQNCRHRARLHGAPSGHDHRRHRQCAAGRRDAGAVPRRAHRPGDGAAAAGAHAARRRRRASLGGGSEVGRQAGATSSRSGGRRFASRASARRRRRTCCPTAAMPSC